MADKPIGMLFIVATPIGNLKDITLRALEVLNACDTILCEERRVASTLLSKLKVCEKALIEVNEHNEVDLIPQIATMLAEGKQLALMSDCGTPLFSDPGTALLAQVVEMGFPVIPIPGPSSLMTALSITNFPMKEFHFAGFLARQPEQRKAQLQKLRGYRCPVVIMDTPYRLSALLEDVGKVFGANHQITLACDLTLPGERIFRGKISRAVQVFSNQKREFILILHP